MEHRCGSRGIVRYPITLLSAERHHIFGVLRNLGAGGAYIDELARPLCRHQLIDVVIRKPDGSVVDSWQWPTMVLRCDEQAAGVMFDRMHFAELHPILATLRQSAEVRARTPRRQHGSAQELAQYHRPRGAAPPHSQPRPKSF